MGRRFRHKKKGFTLLEILITIVILIILASLVIPQVIRQMEKAKEAEAVQSLGAIRSAELFIHNLTGKFVAAVDEMGIQSALGLVVGGGFYQYTIIDADEENFRALATPIGPLSDWLKELEIDKDGMVGYLPGSGGGGSSGSSGGSSGGGSSGGSGGSNNNSGGGGSSSVIGYGTTHGSVGGTAIPIVTPPSTDTRMPFPTNVTATANDGWLHIGWDPGSSGSKAIVYRAPKVNGVIGDFTVLTGTPNDGWSDQVSNGVEYCYQVTSYNTSTEQQSVPSSPPVCETASTTSTAALAVGGAETALTASTRGITEVDGVSSGAQIAAWIETVGWPVLYGRTSCSVTGGQTLCTEAYFDPNTNTLVLGLDLLSNAQQSAVVLSHEGMHAIWREDYNEYLEGVPGRPLYGKPPDPPGGVRSTNSIDQEYSAFLTELQVYYDLKKNHNMPVVSRWDAILPKFLNTTTGAPLASDSEAKIYLRSIYTDLPEY